MSSWAKVGMKVVCVDASATTVQGKKELQLGKVYTIRWSGNFSHPLCGNLHSIRLHEVTRSGIPKDCPFRTARFRPLVTKTQEQDMEIFRKIADDTFGRLDVYEEMLNSH